VGKGDIRQRVYDKGLKAGKDGTLPMWSKVWSDADGQGDAFVIPDGYVLARFEWQLRRGFLRELAELGGPMKVRTLAEFKQCAPSILEYLCNDWFKFCGPEQGIHLHVATASEVPQAIKLPSQLNNSEQTYYNKLSRNLFSLNTL
jgi:hypothetical protein